MAVMLRNFLPDEYRLEEKARKERIEREKAEAIELIEKEKKAKIIAAATSIDKNFEYKINEEIEKETLAMIEEINIKYKILRDDLNHQESVELRSIKNAQYLKSVKLKEVESNRLFKLKQKFENDKEHKKNIDKLRQIRRDRRGN